MILEYVRNDFDVRKWNMFKSTITSKGQTTIPHEVRAALNVRAGDSLTYEIHEGQATIRPHPGARSVVGSLASNKGKGKSFKFIREEAARIARKKYHA